LQFPALLQEYNRQYSKKGHHCDPIDLHGIAPVNCNTEVTSASPLQPQHNDLPPYLARVESTSAELLLEPPALSASSPVTWRPAEEVIPAEFLAEPCVFTTSANRELSKVYARQPKSSVQHATQPPESPPRTPPPPAASSTFIEKVSKPLDIALPIPTVKQQRRCQNYVGTEPPRRSRRIAKLPPENHNPAAASVCRELGFTEDDSRVSAAMMEKYQVFFNTPLERNHVKVMAAMLHKELPEELPVQASGAIVVV